MSKTGLVAQNREEWCALSDAAAIHVLPPMAGAGGGMTDGLTVRLIHCICYQVSYELKTLKHKYSMHYSDVCGVDLFLFMVMFVGIGISRRKLGAGVGILPDLKKYFAHI